MNPTVVRECPRLDHKRGRKVAVKIIKNQKEFQKQGIVEVRLLQHLMKSVS